MPTKEGLTEELQQAETKFDERFESTFQLQEKVNCEPTRKPNDPLLLWSHVFQTRGSVPCELNMSSLRKISFAGPLSDAT